MQMSLGQKLAGYIPPSFSVSGDISHGTNLSLRDADGAGGDE
jgi:hypothetical protein